MLEHLPEEVRRALMSAPDRARSGRHRLSVHVGDAVFPLLQMWDGGFTVATERTPRLRGLVDLYDGPRHISQCLIIATQTDDEVTRYEVKRETPARDAAARDYADEGRAPVAGMLPRPA